MSLSDEPPPADAPCFMGATSATRAEGFDAAIFGAPHGTPYPGLDNRIYRSAPDAFRKALAERAMPGDP